MLGHTSHPRMPLASCRNSFTSASSPVRVLSHHPSGQQRNSHPKAFTSIKASSAIQVSPLLLLKTTLQHHFPTKLKTSLWYIISLNLGLITSIPDFVFPRLTTSGCDQFLPALILGLPFTLCLEFLLQPHSAALSPKVKSIQLPVSLCLRWLSSWHDTC